MILYKDGKEVARIQASGELQQNDTPLSIGGRLNSGQDLKGSIDEVMLYNRALTPKEVEKAINEKKVQSLGVLSMLMLGLRCLK